MSGVRFSVHTGAYAGEVRCEYRDKTDLAARLFQTLDPVPFRERDLADEAEEFIVGWARELPKFAPISIAVHLPEHEARSSAARLFDAARLTEMYDQAGRLP